MHTTSTTSYWKTATRWTARTLCAAILLGLIGSGNVHAQNAQDIVITLKAQKVVQATDGKEVLKVASHANPGEVIQYDAVYKNTSRNGVKDLKPTLPIPRGLEYLPDSAKPAPSQASVDGKSFAAIPLTRRVTSPTGEVKEEVVPVSEYRALRWEMGDLDAGKTLLVSARARIAR
jgi:uncharacterized repeat protein (TIGR01451 family)